jgi:Leucine-rich repeat (LRR) protein
MTSLEQIDLSHNKLGALPDGLSALTQLRSVALGHNQLRALPADLLARPLVRVRVGVRVRAP